MPGIQLLQDDITRLQVDAIVNAANSSLMGGGGVDGAIHRAGGRQILEECRQIVARQGGCKTGEAVITTGGLLPARFVIHTVGPVWHGGHQNEARLLASCYQNSLKIAVSKALTSIAFPNISTGVYGYPKKQAAEVAVGAVKSFLQAHPEKTVMFVCFDEENYTIYKDLLE